MALTTIELAVVIGVCVSVGILCIAIIVICVVFKTRKTTGSKRLNSEAEANTNDVWKDEKKQTTQSAEANVRPESTNEDIETTAKVQNEAASQSERKTETETPEIITESTTLDQTDDAVLYATVNKKSKADSDVKEHEDKAESDVSGGSGKFITSRNSPDGAPDKLSSTGSNSFTDRTNRKDNMNINSNNNMDVVYIEDDVTKRPPDGAFVHVDHEISFSSFEDDQSSIASPPSVVFHEKTYHSNQEQRKVQTLTRPSKAALDSLPEKAVYHTVPGSVRRVIPPDDMGTARVFVSSDGAIDTTRHIVHREPIGDAPLSRINMAELNAANLRMAENRARSERAIRHAHRSNQTWTQNTMDSRRYRQAPDKHYSVYRYDPRDNISMRTDAGYAMSEYAIPTARHRYVSASTTGSLSRDHSYSLDEPIYYVPSRRSSIGSAYSLVASTYNPPRQYVSRRYLPAGRYKMNKRPSMMDLHQMKYRSYKGGLAPFNVPL